jgi:hypothetical protein
MSRNNVTRNVVRNILCQQCQISKMMEKFQMAGYMPDKKKTQEFAFYCKSWLSFSRNVYRYNRRCSCSKNVHVLHEVPLHGLQVRVWYAVSAQNCRACGLWRNKFQPLHRNDSDTVLHRTNRRREIDICFFQNSAMTHTVNCWVTALKEVFSIWLISCFFWCSRRSDFNLWLLLVLDS